MAARVPVCRLPGCHRPVHVDAVSGVEHDYCGRTHAKQDLGDDVADPHGCCHTCKLPGCEEPVYFERDTGRVHEFCCKSHSDLAIRRGDWAEPLKRLQGLGAAPCAREEQCSLNGCAAPRYRDPTTGLLHDYCGRSHAQKAKQQGLLPAPLADPTIDAKYEGNIPNAGAYTISRLTPQHEKYGSVIHQFESQWKHPTPTPAVVSVLQIRNSREIWEAYEAKRQQVGNEQRRWHGTASASECNFAKDLSSGGASGRPCGNTACRLCNIAGSGFQLSHAGTGTGGTRMSLRYGPGLYFSSTSSKSNDYAEGSATQCRVSLGERAAKRRRGSAVGTTVERRCMLLCKVALGRQHIAQDNGFVNGFDPNTATQLGWSGAEVQTALKGADSVVAIPGTTPGINYDEAIIYEKSQAIPSYVVVYDMP